LAVSVPLYTPSKQLATAQTPAGQAFDWQSIDPEQALPFAHGAQLPPQSTSVSMPFLTLSVHVGSLQTPAEHEPDAQSAFTAHRRPYPHGVSMQPVPPQSTSDSSPFRKPSEHVGGAHCKNSGLQFPTVQSELALHVEPSAHLRVQFEPQSTSASVPFLTLSLQVGF
jgi:hypothetical protein